MRKYMKTLAIASALVAGLAAAPALNAHDSAGSRERGATMGPGMMGQGGMMGMMGQMGRMMENCNKMMQSMRGGPGSEQPNQQRHKDTPSAPGKKG